MRHLNIDCMVIHSLTLLHAGDAGEYVKRRSIMAVRNTVFHSRSVKRSPTLARKNAGPGPSKSFLKIFDTFRHESRAAGALIIQARDACARSKGDQDV